MAPPRARRRQWQHQSEAGSTTTGAALPPPRAGSTGGGGDSAPATAKAASAASAPALPPPLPTYADVASAVRARGMVLERETRGPFYRIDLYEGEEMAQRRAEKQAEKRRRWRERQGGGTAAAATSPPPLQRELLATTDGFCVPPPLGGYVHCDTLRIPQRAMLGEEEDEDEGAADGSATTPKTAPTSALGLMPLVGCAVLTHARELRCTRAEILAIDDDPQQHARLVTYYRYFGFRPKHRVGGRGFLVDLPHLLVWGGEGLRMDLDVDATLARWGRALSRER